MDINDDIKDEEVTNAEYVPLEELDDLEVKGDPDQQLDTPEKDHQMEDEFAGEEGAKEELRQALTDDRDTKDDE